MDGQEFLAQAKKRANSQKKKHLPKRASNDRRKARCKASWLRGEARKAARRALNEAQHRANAKRGYTKRHAHRHGLPL
jgi:hypothetical protein